MREDGRGTPGPKPAMAMLATGIAIAGLLAWLSWTVTRPDQPGRDAAER